MSNAKKTKPVEEPKPTLIIPDEVRARAAAITDAKKANGAEVIEPIAHAGEEPSAMHEIEAASCGNCRFFVAQGESKSPNGPHNVDVGQCRAHSPQALVVGMQQHPITNAVTPVVNGYFPLTNEEIWCGDWLSRRPSIEDGSIN